MRQRANSTDSESYNKYATIETIIEIKSAKYQYDKTRFKKLLE